MFFILTPYNRFTLQKLTVTRLIKKYTVFYRSQRFHNNPFPDILSHINPALGLTDSFFKINFNIILASTNRDPESPLFSCFKNTIFYAVLIFTCVLHASPVLSLI
jgi:hypothetical protein